MGAKLFSGKKELKIMLLGLDSVGKTTMLQRLKLGEVVTTIPTIEFNFESFKYKSFNFAVWDFTKKFRVSPLWRHYLRDTQGLIFVVDSSDRERIGESCEELSKILREDELRDSKLLVFANKQDLPNVMSVEEVTDKLGLHSLNNRKWYIQSCSVISGVGLHEGLDWLSNAIDT